MFSVERNFRQNFIGDKRAVFASVTELVFYFAVFVFADCFLRVTARNLVFCKSVAQLGRHLHSLDESGVVLRRISGLNR